ncbi:unnamed protein product [Adineta steineri]|uniref:MADS-box domain-containing protein n=1 Tax=Adineta steineri TaxID=433720 RepID=A0A814QQ80_9BILA|nr:unnamed protein product [Adineta steineri]CAF4040790.1 unnamed protein product [Adineta steineri]
MSYPSYSEQTNSKTYDKSYNTIIVKEDNDGFIDDDDDVDDDDDNSNDRSSESIDNSMKKKKAKKTLGRVKIKMAYIDNKVRRYTTFSKRKTGIMKKAYELATLTGTEVMLLVASETGHVYTYATPKLQPMITSEAGKALIQTCLEKDDSIVESSSTTTTVAAAAILNNDDVICVEDNQSKKRTSLSTNDNISQNEIRPIKRAKLKSSDEIKQINSTSPCTSLLSTLGSSPTTVAVPLSCFLNPDTQQQSITNSTSFTIDLNSLKNNGMNVVFTPSPNSPPTSPSSNIPLMLAFGNFRS